jgi:hypothetical protein
MSSKEYLMSLKQYELKCAMAVQEHYDKLMEFMTKDNDATMLDLLQKISEDYKLDYTELCKKYKPDSLPETNKRRRIDEMQNSEFRNIALLDKIEINGKSYWVDENGGGNIYDPDTYQVIGSIEDGEIELTNTSV